MRWRTQKEVFEGKGQFICGAKGCDKKAGLRSFEVRSHVSNRCSSKLNLSWQVNFAYEEEKLKKNALVKLRLCPECGQKLNYKHLKRLRKEDVRQW
jgi:DNA-directed RNA polymerase subunit M/transcription elongation factor TFIIS